MFDFINNLIGTTPKERRTQLFFRDDGKCIFRPLLLEDSCLVEKEGDIVIKAWKHFFNPQIPFNGFKNIKADMISLGHSRDIIFDPFKKIPDCESPGKTADEIDKWVATIAESQRYKNMNKPSSMLLLDKITMFLGAGFILLLISLIIRIT